MSSEREKRARLSHACDRCRKRHVKCDGDYPICGNCKSVNGECSYSHPGSKRGYVETIDDRLSKIEQVLSRYLEGADSQQHGSHDADREVAVPEVALTTTHDIVNLSTKKADTTTLADSLSSLTLKSTCYFTLKTEHSDTTEPGAVGKEPKKAPPSLEPPLPSYSEIRGPKDMPPKDLYDHLVGLFMTHGYSLKMPIIHKQTFQKQFKDKNNLLLQNGVFALASLFSDDPRVRSDPERPETAGDIFFQRARDLFDDYMDKPRLSTLQAIHLLTQFCIKSSQHSFRIWILIGIQVRMSIDLGLHRDCYKWNLGKVEKALRNRLFWASYVAEVVSCAAYGKPLPIYDFDTRLPYEIDEDGEDAQDVVNFMHLCKLFKILANIVQSKPYFTQPSYLRNTLPAIEASLSSWQLALPTHLQLPSTSDPDSTAVQPYTAFLHLMYNLVIIQLHRPYVDSDAYPHINSREECTKAAISITKLTSCIPVNNRALYYTFNLVSVSLAHAGMIHAMNVSDSELSACGEHYMRKTLDWLGEFARASGPSMEGVCGVADVRNMLESLFKVQKDKLQEIRAARAAERGDGGGYTASGRGGNGGSGGKCFSEVKTIPTPPPSTTQENIDIDPILSPTIVKAEKSPEMSDAKVSSIPTGEKTRTSTSSPALRQAAAASASASASASSLMPRKARSLEHARGQDHLRPRQPFVSGMPSTRLYKTNPTPEPSPQFPQQHLQQYQQQHQQQHQHQHQQQQQQQQQQHQQHQQQQQQHHHHHQHQHQPHQHHHQPHQQHPVHLSDGGLDSGQFMSPMILSSVSLADPPIVPSSFNAANGYPHGVEYGAVNSQGPGHQVYLVDEWPMDVSNPPPSAGHNRSASSSSSPSSPAVNTSVVAAGSGSNTTAANGQDQNAAFRLQDPMAGNYVPFSITSDHAHSALLVGDAANPMLDGGGDTHATATPRGGGASRGNASNRSSQGSDGSMNAAQQVSQQQQLLGHLHHHQVPVVSQMPVEQLHAVNGQPMWNQWN